MLQKLKTEKLFYGKYPYKISTKFKGASGLRYINLFKFLANKYPGSQIDYDQFNLFRQVAEKHKDKIRQRIETNTINFFIEDKETYEDICLSLNPYIVSITEPNNEKELNFLNNKNKIVLCDKYPHGQYRYKVVFRAVSNQLKSNLLQLSNTYPESTLKFSKKSIENLRYPLTYFWHFSFCYVNDKKIITMMYLLGNDYIKRVDEYVLRSSINTVSQDE